MEKVTQEILLNITRIYDTYEDKAQQRSQEERMKKGAKIEKKERDFLESMNKLTDILKILIKDMEASKNIKAKTELRDTPLTAKQCLNDITNIRKKSLMFKVSENLENLIEQTRQHILSIQKQLPNAGESKFLCCGVDGAKQFKQTIQKFKQSASQWKLLAILEPKDSVENFISPKFNPNDFKFVQQILRKSWPSKEVVEKVKVQTKQVIKYVNTGNSKPSRLVQANQFIYGINREENVSYGLKIYQEEAENDDATAAAFLGKVYEEGTICTRDLTKAVRYYQKSMRANDSYANYRFAMALVRGELSKTGVNKEDIQKGVKLLEQAATAEKPSPEAMVELGELYEKGHFDSDRSKIHEQSVDLKKAFAMYKKAREMHLPRASNNLGVLYINNPTFSDTLNSTSDKSDIAYENLQKGRKYLEQAQANGFPQAFYNLGCLYESGSIGKKDQEEALHCFYNGGLKGDHLCRLRFVYQLINQTSIMKQQYEDHYRIAYRWLENIVHKIDISEENSRESGSYSIYTSSEKAEALFYLGLMHEYGFGVDKSPKKAFDFYMKSGDMKYPPAKNKLGDCYFSGYGTRENREVALGCYLNAADDDNSEAMVNLGTIHLNGIPGLVQRNYNKAYEYFIKAMGKQNVNAMIHLSYMYRSGLGFEANMEMAKKLLEEAARNRSSTALYMLRQMGGDFDDTVLFNNLENQFFTGPKKINLKQIVPLISGIKQF